MSKATGGVVAGFALMVAAGLVVALVQSGVFEPAFNSGPVHQAAAAASQQPDTSASAAPSPAVQKSQGPTAEPVVTPPANVSVPPPLDNKTITQARVVVVGTKISPTVYNRQDIPGYYASVFTAAGEVQYNAGCYVHWELRDNGVLLDAGDSKCGLQGGWSTMWWPNGTRLDAGAVQVTASITTDWGATAKAEADFTVQ